MRDRGGMSAAGVPDVDASVAFDRSPIGVAHVAPDGRWLRVNAALCELLGYTEAELTGGMTIYDVTHPDEVSTSSELLTDSMERTGGYRLRKRYLTKAGDVRHVEVSVSLLLDASGTPVCTLSHVQDRTDEVEAFEQAARAASRFESIITQSSDVVLVCDETGRQEYVSPNVERLLGRTAEEIVGQAFGANIHPDDLATVRKRFAGVVRFGGSTSATYRIRHADGSWRWVETRCVDLRDDPHIEGFVCSLRDVTERLVAQETLRQQATHDALTGLPNRSLLNDRIASAISRAERTGIRFAVMFCDLDHFKRINDTLGHDVGDLVLLSLAKRLSERLRRSDTLARQGGDEFVVLAEALESHDPLGSAEELARDLIEVLGEPLEVQGHRVVIGASVGVAMYEHGMDLHDMLRNADVAMYAAKERGRGQVAVHDDAMRARAIEQFRMASIVRTAVDEGGVGVDIQPIVDLVTGRVVGAEALVRLEVDGVRYPPAAFLDAAEESGAIIPIGEEVLLAALDHVSTWPESTYIAVNMSAQQLTMPNLDQVVAAALAASGVSPDRLVIEVTETTLVESTEHLLHTLNRMATSGIRFALDDFGTGWSSLSYLRMFPVSIVKIDRSFVQGVARIGSGDIEVIRAVLSLSDALGITVVAEGIETDIQAAILSELGCPFGQGFLFGHPVEDIPQLHPGTGTSPATRPVPGAPGRRRPVAGRDVSSAS